MAWIVLLVAGVLEAVWATALAESRGFRRIVPTVVFAVALAASLGGLAYAMRSLPTGTAYAVWVGVGAVLTALWAVVTGKERMNVARAVLLAGLVGCVAGLKVVS
ncbi:multidrug efflux SMR transporter [Nocardia puris]|uniref:Quaternary ammonium compound-resistance protein SugE n=1 Tax=Nocardia puris TaxID=208602 RepID=A0A366DVQ7_9NOCA|nr:multidrug efflux SMR transporter [Nocardia puris]MBF6210079.1 multidrug efflux SMR transporter [Nocardia puris]MBF6368270.1 multidrug efflux SMR transporter [Nocardia puris]MBF6458011.1 multidrug efflux SMR transporter [Nocardia puris]RBO94173.1 quaternary ammonium compound-resistance protein SugE [Nocardia puris]